MSADKGTGTKNPLNVIAAVGLALGGLFGMLGTLVAARNLQSAFWAIDGVGVVVGTALLGIKLFRKGNDVVAGGFLVFTIGESVMPERRRPSQEAFLRLPQAQPYGLPAFCSQVLPGNLPVGFAWRGLSVQSFSRLLRQEYFGENRFCPPPLRCPFSPTPSLS